MQLPIDFIEKYQHLLKNQATEFLSSFNNEVTAGFRLNPLKVQAHYIDEDCTQPIAHIDNAYYGAINGNDIDHLAGWIYSQDPSAMHVAQFAQPKPHERVLDLCAAPGGKTTQLASLMQDTGLLVANEINRSRARVLSSNVERWGLQHTLVTNNAPQDLTPYFPEFFDCIVVDAPCSGEGLFRKDPEAMQYWSIEYVQKCAQRQRQILIEAVKMLRPGGRLIYSTCTFAPEEDEQNINWLTEQLPLKISPLPHYAGMDTGRPEWGNNNLELRKAVRLFPHHYQGEGHFICALQKAGSPVAGPTTKINTIKLPNLKLWQEFVDHTLVDVHFDSLIAQKNTLYNAALEFSQHHPQIVRNGLMLGEFKKNRFEPNHALVLALKPEQFQQIIELNAEQFQHFVHGEALIINNQGYNKGWVALSFEHKIFSWGKLVGTQLKNFYPKGLRQ